MVYHYKSRRRRSEQTEPRRAKAPSAEAAKAPSRSRRANDPEAAAQIYHYKPRRRPSRRPSRRDDREQGRKSRPSRRDWTQAQTIPRRGDRDKKTPSRGAAGYSFNIKLFYFDGEKLRADRAERRRRSARRRSRRRAAKAPPQAVRAGKNAENRRISFINKLLKTEFQFFLRGRVIVRASEKIEKWGILTRDRGIRSAQARPSAPGIVRLHKNWAKTLCKIPYCKTPQVVIL